MKRIVEFMKRNYKIILVVTALSAILWSFIPREKKEDPEKDKLILELLTMVLERGHYSPVEINDDFSKKYIISIWKILIQQNDFLFKVILMNLVNMKLH